MAMSSPNALLPRALAFAADQYAQVDLARLVVAFPDEPTMARIVWLS